MAKKSSSLLPILIITVLLFTLFKVEWAEQAFEKGDLSRLFGELKDLDDPYNADAKYIRNQDRYYTAKLKRKLKANDRVCLAAQKGSRVARCCRVLEKHANKYTSLHALVARAKATASRSKPKAKWPTRCSSAICPRCPKRPPLPNLRHDKIKARFNSYCRLALVGGRSRCCKAIKRSAAKKTNHGRGNTATDPVVRLLKAHLEQGHSLPAQCNNYKRGLARRLNRGTGSGGTNNKKRRRQRTTKQ